MTDTHRTYDTAVVSMYADTRDEAFEKSKHVFEKYFPGGYEIISTSAEGSMNDAGHVIRWHVRISADGTARESRSAVAK